MIWRKLAAPGGNWRKLAAQRGVWRKLAAQVGSGITAGVLTQYLTVISRDYRWTNYFAASADGELLSRMLITTAAACCFYYFVCPAKPAIIAGFGIALATVALPTDLGWELCSPDDYFCLAAALVVGGLFYREEKRNARRAQAGAAARIDPDCLPGLTSDNNGLNK